MNYSAHYQRLMERAPKNKPKIGYWERHRIVPGCMGGHYVKSNIAWLTPEEHYVAHQLLVKMHPDHEGLLNAAQKMTICNDVQQRNNKWYGWLRRKMAESMKGELNRAKKPGVREKISASLKERNRLHPKPKKQPKVLTLEERAANLAMRIERFKQSWYSKPRQKRSFSTEERSEASKRMTGNTINNGVPKTAKHKAAIGRGNRGKRRGQKPWNAGLTKADPRVAKYTENRIVRNHVRLRRTNGG